MKSFINKACKRFFAPLDIPRHYPHPFKGVRAGHNRFLAMRESPFEGAAARASGDVSKLKKLFTHRLSIPFIFILLIAIFSCKGPDSATDPSGNKKNRSSGYYTEAHRPQFHFSPEANWMNDPNGMVYEDGEYHLFYQYYPDSNVWGPMHWGHAISEDMIYWQHLPVALYPDTLGYIFSGSAVADKKNTSGFGSDGDYPLVAIYTYHDTAGLTCWQRGFSDAGDRLQPG